MKKRSNNRRTMRSLLDGLLSTLSMQNQCKVARYTIKRHFTIQPNLSLILQAPSIMTYKADMLLHQLFKQKRYIKVENHFKNSQARH